MAKWKVRVAFLGSAMRAGAGEPRRHRGRFPLAYTRPRHTPSLPRPSRTGAFRALAVFLAAGAVLAASHANAKEKGLAAWPVLTFVALLFAGSAGAQTADESASSGICDRTEQVRTAILAQIDDSDNCWAVTDAHLGAVTGRLDLSRAGISSLRADDFSGLVSLRQLDLSSNQLRTLPPGLFDSLTVLYELRLYSNQLETLRKDVFTGIRRVRILDLEFNRLPMLPFGVFSGLDLTFLGLEANKLQTLHSGMFAGLDVEVLDLSHNGTTSVSADAFSRLTSLNELDLGYNNLNSLPPGVLSGLTNLRHLWLEKNPGADFTFGMTVERIPGTNKVVLEVPKGAPFDMTTTISATGGALPTRVSSVTVPTGRTTSGEITIVPLDGTTVVLGAAPPLPSTAIPSTGGVNRFTGVATAVSGPVTFGTGTNANRPPTGLPLIAGTARVGETLAAGVGDIADEDGLDEVAYAYQWVSNDGDADTDIQGATGASYELTEAEQGDTIKVRVTFTDDAGHTETLTSAATAEVAARPNRRATGAPSIAGTPEVGQTLTASTDGIADEDGLDDAVFAYRWVSNDGDADTDIQGATGASYELTEAEQGDTIKVRVTFTDDGGTEESLESAATDAVAPAPEPLTATFAGVPASHDGSAFTFTLTFSAAPEVGYAVLRDDAFAVSGGDVDSARRKAPPSNLEWEIAVEPSGDGDVTVELSATSNCAASDAICTADGTPLTDVPAVFTVAGPEEVPVATNTPATGAPTISGTPQVGETLSASVSDIADADGLDDASFAYQWIRGSADIEGATDSSYTLVSADEGETIRVRVTFSDDEGHEESLTSAATDAVAPAPEPLTATFAGVPASHDGSAFTFTLTFSAAPEVGYAVLRDDAFAVSGGDVDSARRKAPPSNLEWEIAVEPSGDGDVTVELSATSNCAASDAICTADGTPLTDVPAVFTVAGPEEVPVATNTPATGAPTISGTPQVGETLSASVSDIADADGLDDASFAYQWIRGSADIEGATDSSYTLVSADEGETIRVRVTFSDDEGHEESLTSAATDAVAPAPEPLTAAFSDVPSEHAGAGEMFTFGLTFSEAFGLSYLTLRDEAFSVSGGTVRRAKRKQQGSNQSWTIHVEPSGHGPVTVTLPETTDCGATGAICTDDDRPLSHSLSATVAGPVGISVDDARVEEDDGAVLSFAVTLSRAASGALTVDYATSDGSAQAGADYTAASGTLTFQAGESSKTIEVAVLDDSHDDDGETLTLTLSNPSSGRLTDGKATGTIENRDPLPRALLARFGRTAAVHVVEHVEERLAAPRQPGFRGRFAGRELRRGMERDIALSFLRQFGGGAAVQAPGGGVHGPRAGSGVIGAGAAGTPGLGGSGVGMPGAAGPLGAGTGMPGVGAGAMGGAPGAMSAAAGPDGGLFGGGLQSMGLGGDTLLTGSAFALNRETRHGGILSFWSRGAQSHFSGREGALSLGGDVRTTMFGADYAKGPMVAGLSLSHSRGLGEYAGATGGQVASAVTGLYPWLGYQATDRVTVWGVTGYGRGGLRLTPDSGTALESGLSMAMAAAGTRGELIAGGAGGFALAFKADALWVGTAIDGVDSPAGRLKATDAAVTRFRTGLEGSHDYTLGGRVSLRPSVEVGLRHDGGDAETGVGMDVGGGLVVSDTSTGLAVDVRVRMLLVHQAEGFRERGMALSLSYNPTPSTPLGFTATVAPSWGGQAQSGAEALWGRETMAGMGHGGLASGTRLEGEVGYGLPVGRRFVGTPRVGVSASEHGRDYRVGYGLGVLGGEGTKFELGVDAQRRESPLQGGTDHGALARATMRW